VLDVEVARVIIDVVLTVPKLELIDDLMLEIYLETGGLSSMRVVLVVLDDFALDCALDTALEIALELWAFLD
jgi:hypothetical protein